MFQQMLQSGNGGGSNIETTTGILNSNDFGYVAISNGTKELLRVVITDNDLTLLPINGDKSFRLMNNSSSGISIAGNKTNVHYKAYWYEPK